MSEKRGVSFLYSRLFPPCEPERHLSVTRLYRAGLFAVPVGLSGVWLSRRAVCNRGFPIAP
jgi:hypothetical protein